MSWFWEAYSDVLSLFVRGVSERRSYVGEQMGLVKDVVRRRLEQLIGQREAEKGGREMSSSKQTSKQRANTSSLNP